MMTSSLNIMIKQLDLQLYPVTFQDAVVKNPCLTQSVIMPTERDSFFLLFDRHGFDAFEKTLSNKEQNVFSSIKRRIKKLFIVRGEK